MAESASITVAFGVALAFGVSAARQQLGEDGAGPEEELGRDLMLAAEKQAGLLVRVGIAGSKLAARLDSGRPSSPVVIPAGAAGPEREHPFRPWRGSGYSGTQSPKPPVGTGRSVP